MLASDAQCGARSAHAAKVHAQQQREAAADRSRVGGGCDGAAYFAGKSAASNAHACSETICGEEEVREWVCPRRWNTADQKQPT
eukprot:6177710-Pleurochrysis_carterae.AAC.1